MRGTRGETNMMNRQQKHSSTFPRSSSGSNNSGSLSNDYSSALSIVARRCSSNRSRTSTASSASSPWTSSPSSRCSSTANSSSSCPVLLSVLAWSVTLLLISSCLGIADAGVLMGHPLGKRSFMQLQCKGIYDKSIFARLDRICEDCYNLFREPQLHTLCRKNCFTSDYFKGCLDVLLLQDEMEQIQKWIKQLHGADPGV